MTHIGVPKYDPAGIRRMIRRGATNATIVARYGCTERTVQRARQAVRGGPAVRRFTPDELERMRAMIFDDECTINEVARTFDTTHTKVARHFPDAPRCTQQQIAEYTRLHRALLKIPDRLAA